jgi:hypothetical protein
MPRRDANCPLGQGQGAPLDTFTGRGSTFSASFVPSRLPLAETLASILTASTAARDIVKSPGVLSVSGVARR